MDLFLSSGASQLNSKVVVLTGTARCGKTLLGNILGSCEHVEHIDEPWLLMMLPILVSQGLVPETFAISMFQTCAFELLNDRVLMRNANFRVSDGSFIGRQKSPQEILERLIGLQTRDDVVRHLATYPTTLVLTLTDTVPFCDFLAKAVPQCCILHVVRDGRAVAMEVADRHWFSDEELSRPRHSYVFRKVEKSYRNIRYMPYWVEEKKEDDFLRWPEYTRGLYYWRRHIEIALSAQLPENSQIYVLRFSDMLNDGGETCHRLFDILQLAPTELTSALLKKNSVCEEDIPGALLEAADQSELEAVQQLYGRIGKWTGL